MWSVHISQGLTIPYIFILVNYSPSATLIIDPTLIFSTFTGSHSDNWGYTATYDESGNFYSGSITLNSEPIIMVIYF